MRLQYSKIKAFDLERIGHKKCCFTFRLWMYVRPYVVNLGMLESSHWFESVIGNEYLVCDCVKTILHNWHLIKKNFLYLYFLCNLERTHIHTYTSKFIYWSFLRFCKDFLEKHDHNISRNVDKFWERKSAWYELK